MQTLLAEHAANQVESFSIYFFDCPSMMSSAVGTKAPETRPSPAPAERGMFGRKRRRKRVFLLFLQHQLNPDLTADEGSRDCFIFTPSHYVFPLDARVPHRQFREQAMACVISLPPPPPPPPPATLIRGSSVVLHRRWSFWTDKNSEYRETEREWGREADKTVIATRGCGWEF